MIFNYVVMALIRVYIVGLYGYIYIYIYKRGTIPLGLDKTSPSLIIWPI